MHFDKFPNPSTFQCWKTSFKTEVCSGSGFPLEAIHGIKEVWSNQWMLLSHRNQSEGVDSRIFEMLDAKIASALKKFIMNSFFQEESQSVGAKGPNGRPISQWKTYGVNDPLILPSDRRS